MTRTQTLFLLMLASAGIRLYGQDQHEELFLPVLMEVRVDDSRTDQFTVMLYKNNEVVTELPPGPRGAFMLELDVNTNYTVVIDKPGFRPESIVFDTRIPADMKRYKAYTCLIDLDRKEKYAHSDAFYLDFPSALVRWDPLLGRFEHSEAYLSDIHTKIVLSEEQAQTR